MTGNQAAPPPLPGAQPPVPPPLPVTPPAAPPAVTPAAPPAAPLTAPAELSYTCATCGAQIAYAPGTATLRCGSCGTVQQIEAEGTIVEHSYDEWAALPPKPVATIGSQVLVCRGCGASTETVDLAGACQFCGGVLVAQAAPEGLVAPEAVVPFHVDKRAANTAFGGWVKSRWFAPSALKKVGSTEAIAGTYIPHWTYDARTRTQYRGQRGDHYYTTETHTVSDGNGGTRTETRQVQHTRWSRASGEVARDFDDVLVPASHRLDDEKLDKMGPWTLGDAQPFVPDYLAGYSALRYDVDPDAGLGVARQVMERTITEDCRRDIGGDEQRVQQMDVSYRATMFKLVLLPLWIATYLFAGTTYQVFVNANTGEVVGDRPYSKVKIAFAVLAALVVVAVVVAVIAISRK